ncbi:unnamed protein product [Ilex paraguariensis]|uniref:Beta-amyrin synthase n=1 Tax=Ilex paraguariensis TaxID=185542 RepID=A0ABC8TAP6_9AQUA
MWKLKIAEGHGPYLYSTNNFVGRQIWEFDHEAGTPEEREEVEKAREEYRKNRKQGVHPCGDLLMRMQLIKESGLDLLSIPPVRLGEKEEVTYEAVTTAVKKAVRLNRAIQAKDGHWPAENAGVNFFTPPLVSVLFSNSKHKLLSWPNWCPDECVTICRSLPCTSVGQLILS